MSRSHKGSKYEREICRFLSEWWSGGKRDDIFWRPGGSGGRAKSRGRKGKRTEGQHGDVVATHSSGEALIDLLTIEIKRGYTKITIADIFDKAPNMSQQIWESWFQQVYESWQQSGAYSWMLITKRDMREPLIFMRQQVFMDFVDRNKLFPLRPVVIVKAYLTLVHKDKLTKKKVITKINETILCTTLKNFTKLVDPMYLKEWAKIA